MAPSAETTQAYGRLLGPDAVDRPEPGAAPVRQMVPFVGRLRELKTLRATWGQVTSGGPDSARVAVISGEAGIGKSRLAEELLIAARRLGGVAAAARCFAGERPPPLAPVAEWLRSDAYRPAVDGLDPLWRAEVAPVARARRPLRGRRRGAGAAQ